MNRDITFIATGDSFISNRLTTDIDISAVSDVVSNGDVKFTNFEMTTPENHRYPSSISGGTWASAHKDVVKDIKSIGFNCVAWANNHTLDFLHDGLIATKRNLEKMDIVHSGVGMDMEEASCPKYIKVNQSTVGLISVTTTFDDTWIAGHRRYDGPGRPGVNGVRMEKVFRVSGDELQFLKRISEKIGINYERELDIKEGFLEEDPGKFHFGDYVFEENISGENLKEVINETDLKRNIHNIRKAKSKADAVVVSIHSHEMFKTHKDQPAKFVEELSKSFIDAGADAIIGHGPHILRGIEIYKEKPIFYSLGNFIFQNDNVEFLPSDFYDKYGLTGDNHIIEAINARNRNGERGLGTNYKVWESVIAKWNFKDRVIELIPIDLGFEMDQKYKGWPKMTDDTGVLRRLAELSKLYGTKIDIAGGKGIIEF